MEASKVDTHLTYLMVRQASMVLESRTATILYKQNLFVSMALESSRNTPIAPSADVSLDCRRVQDKQESGDALDTSGTSRLLRLRSWQLDRTAR
jgi:hypothetical protein